MNNKPSLRQTVEGQALQTEARVRLNAAHYAKIGVTVEDELQETVNLIELAKKQPKVQLAEVFSDLRAKEDCIIEKTKGRLKHDEKEICEKMVKKFGQENFAKMSKDIKTNYLQWSKGQCEKNVKLFLETQ